MASRGGGSGAEVEKGGRRESYQNSRSKDNDEEDGGRRWRVRPATGGGGEWLTPCRASPLFSDLGF